MGQARADVKVTKQKVKKFVRYKEGAEMYSMCQSKFERMHVKQRQHISWTSLFW